MKVKHLLIVVGPPQLKSNLRRNYSPSIKSCFLLSSQSYTTTTAEAEAAAAMKKPCSLFFVFFLFLIIAAATQKQQQLPVELISLLSLKSSLNDPLSTFHDWDPSPVFSQPSLQDPVWCTWSGIRCDPKSTRITSLDLSSRNLSGPIPEEICYLSGLLHLNLSRNALDGPLSIFQLPELLTTLDISYNSFNSTFPARVISNLKFLRVLDAFSNSFTGPLPQDLVRLHFLEHLNLGGSYFEGKIPNEYGDFPRLRSLCLQGNDLNGPIPPRLGSLSQLEHMEIGYNSYEGTLPTQFGSLSTLRYMDVAAANLSGPLPPELGNLSNLETLLLFRNRFDGEIPKSFYRLKALRGFDISNNALSGTVPEFLGTFRELKNLSLMNNFFTGDIPESLGTLPNLEILQLWNNSLTGILPQKLGSSSSLRLWKLDASSNSLTGPIPPDICSGNNLQKLLLFSNNLSHGLPRSLAKCSSLNRLRLQNNNLNGSIPSGFGMLPNLSFVDLSNNAFTGLIPEDLGEFVQYLNVSGNSFGTALPMNIWAGPNLQVLSASSAKITGPIPDFVGCKSVYRIELDRNALNGTIPWNIGHCEKLLYLNMSRNSITGIIPWEISALPSITNLDLSRNFLTGTIPSHFDVCTTLDTFDVSYNQLTGPVPSSSSIFRNLHPSSFAGNDGLCGGILLDKPCDEDAEAVGPRPRRRRTEAGAILWITAAVFGIGLFVVIAVSRCFHSRYGAHRGRHSQEVGPWKLTAFQRLNFTANDVLECLSLSDNNKVVIGMGSAGTVYRAEMPGGEIIAVKKLWGIKQKADTIRRRRGVLAEVDVLGNVRHRNIVRLLGCVTNKECTMLLYEYMPNGNLDELLHNKSNLLADWFTRYKIALSVAQGICYLHHDCDPVIVHRDLKPSNILLDAEMEARVADFGVAKLIQSDESMSVIAGSYGYIAPEYAYTLQVDEKSDIYSYGVVLMEILSGKRSVDPEFGDGNSIVEWVRLEMKTKDGGFMEEILDKNAGASCASVREEMMQLLRIALLCTGKNPADRPSMRDVVLMLQEARPKRKVLLHTSLSINIDSGKGKQPNAVEEC